MKIYSMKISLICIMQQLMQRTYEENMHTIQEKKNIVLIKSLINKFFDLKKGKIMRFGSSIGDEAASRIMPQFTRFNDSIQNAIPPYQRILTAVANHVETHGKDSVGLVQLTNQLSKTRITIDKWMRYASYEWQIIKICLLSLFGVGICVIMLIWVNSSQEEKEYRGILVLYWLIVLISFCKCSQSSSKKIGFLIIPGVVILIVGIVIDLLSQSKGFGEGQIIRKYLIGCMQIDWQWLSYGYYIMLPYVMGWIMVRGNREIKRIQDMKKELMRQQRSTVRVDEQRNEGSSTTGSSEERSTTANEVRPG